MVLNRFERWKRRESRLRQNYLLEPKLLAVDWYSPFNRGSSDVTDFGTVGGCPFYHDGENE